jgi:hypothetical protein
MARLRDLQKCISECTRHSRVFAAQNAQAKNAPVAQLDRAPDYESGGRTFESFRARHFTRSVPDTAEPAVLRLQFWLRWRVRRIQYLG